MLTKEELEEKYGGLLGDSLYIYGNLIIKEGEILSNEFNYDIKSSKASNWIIENKTKVMGRLNYFLRVLRVSGGDAEDCFNFAIYYFLDKKEREVVLNFFGDGEDYNIERYCMSNLKFVVYGYKNHLSKLRGEGTTYLIDGVDTEEKGVGYNIDDVTYENIGGKRFDTPEDMLEQLENKESFKEEMLMFTDYFKEKGFRVFDVLNLFNAIFNIDSVEENALEEKEEMYVRVSKEIGESTSLIESVFNQVMEDKLKNDFDANGIVEIATLFMSRGVRRMEYKIKKRVYDWDDIEEMYE